MVIDISTVARRSGLPASTLRFYEQKGLIASVGRRGNRRLFDENVVDRLAFIALVGSAGFSLDEIAGMLTPDGTPRIDRAALASRAAEIDDTIRDLAALSTWLKHAAACPAPNHMECSSFRNYLDLASGLSRQPPLRPKRLRGMSGVVGGTQSLLAASSSSSHTVASRPIAPAAGMSTGAAPPSAAATASALPSPETTSHTSRER